MMKTKLLIFLIIITGLSAFLVFSFTGNEDINLFLPSISGIFNPKPEISIEILNPFSKPETGKDWTIYFKTQGKADLTITPQDETTINDTEFASLQCKTSIPIPFKDTNEVQKRVPQIKEGELIFYPNWQCSTEGILTLRVDNAGTHTLKFQFGEQVAYAYNGVLTFDSSSVTFTEGMAKRNAPGPFTAGVLPQGKANFAGTTGLGYEYGYMGDALQWSRGNQISGNFYDNFDSNQGSIVFWWTPEFDVATSKQYFTFFNHGGSGSIRMAYTSAGKFRFQIAGNNIDVSQSLTPGATYNIVARWDLDNTLDGTNYACLSINDAHTYGVTSAPTVGIPASMLFMGWNSGGDEAAQGIIEGLTVYRRPLYGGAGGYGIDVGNGDEIAKIYDSDENPANGITPQDPTLVTGSWDVVFCLPTNSSVGALASPTATGEAWSHPHSSNLWNGGSNPEYGFMLDGEFTDDGWALEGTPQRDTGTADADSTTTTIEDDGQGWTEDAEIGYYVCMTSGPANGECTYITDNDADTLTVSPAFSTDPDIDDTSTFTIWAVHSLATTEKIYAGGYKITSDAANEGIYQDITVTAGDDVVIRGLAHGDVNSVPKLILYDQTGSGRETGSLTGTNETGTHDGADNQATVMTDSGESWTVDAWIGYTIYNTTDNSSGEITDNDATTITVTALTGGTDNDWDTNDAYKIGSNREQPDVFIFTGEANPTDSGTHTGADDQAALTDSTKSWSTNYWVGHTVTNTTDGSSGEVTANTATTITATLAGGTDNNWDTNDAYTISGTTTLRVKLINTAASGTAYWHQVEVLANLVNNPSLEGTYEDESEGGGGTVNIAPGWNSRMLEKDGSDTADKETTIFHSGSASQKLENMDWANEGVAPATAPMTQAKFYSTGGWLYATKGGARLHVIAAAIGQDGSTEYSSAVTASSWTHRLAVARNPTAALRWIGFIGSTVSENADDFYVDDAYVFALADVSLTVTPADKTNSTETSGLRVDGRDSCTQTITELGKTSGSIQFRYTPRHNAADALKFLESTNVYIGEWYYDANNYIQLYWSAANTIKMTCSMNGTACTTDSNTWDATGAISAGTTYEFAIYYTGGNNMVFKVDRDIKITLSSIPSSFGTELNTAHWGKRNGGSDDRQADATFDESADIYQPRPPGISPSGGGMLIF